MFLPACHIKIPVEHLLSKFLPLYSPWKLQMCELISQQVRLHECLIAKREEEEEEEKNNQTNTYLEEKIRPKDVSQIDTGHIYEVRKWFSNF